MNQEELRALIENGENERLELKAAIPSSEEIARHIASFANTDGGMIVFGVKEPAQVVGTNQHRVRAMTKAAEHYLSAQPAVSVSSFNLDGHPIVVAKVERSNDLIAASGGYYRRVGDRIRPLNANEIRAHASSGKSPDAALGELSQAIASQTQIIDQLRSEFAKANSWPRKLGIPLGAAVVGAILKSLFDLWLS